MMRESIATQLMRAVFLCYCVVAALVTCVHMIQEYRHTQSVIQQELSSYESIFSGVLARAMWDLDRERLAESLNALNQVPIVVGVKVVESGSDQVFMAQGFILGESGDPLLYEDGRIRVSNQFATELYQHSFPVIYAYGGANRELANVTLYSSSDMVFERVELGFIFLVVNAVLKGLALWLIFIWFSKRKLIQPLKDLTDRIRTIDYENIEKRDLEAPLLEKNELDELQLGFSELLDQVYKKQRDEKAFSQELEKQVEQRTKELIEEKKKVDHAIKVKSEFLATMSHEVRTPMNGVMGMLENLDQKTLTTRNARLIASAQSSARTLMVLINDILDMGRIDSGTLKIERHHFNLHALLHEVTEEFRHAIEDKRIRYEVNLSQVGSVDVFSDAARVRQIVSHLIRNAVKFTESGCISVNARLIELGKNEGELELDVEDSGKGIKQEKMGELFNAFTQEDGSFTRKHGGTGLGLALVKQLCELLRGEVRVESIQGQGSVFSIRIHMDLSGKSVEPNTQNQVSQLHSWPNRHVLLVEDNLINQEVAFDMLTGFGLSVVVVENGSEALEALKGQHFDLVLMDCQMPVMDGYDATRAIRNGDSDTEQQSNKAIPVVALTANVMEGDIGKCFACGMDAYLSKPIDIKKLNSTLKKYII